MDMEPQALQVTPNLDLSELFVSFPPFFARLHEIIKTYLSTKNTTRNPSREGKEPKKGGGTLKNKQMREYSLPKNHFHQNFRVHGLSDSQ